MGEIEVILEEGWGEFKIDSYPKDRRMIVLEEKEIKGQSSENIRFLINELVRRFAKNGVYLEVGTFLGCSLLSAALFNPTTRCIGIDKLNQFWLVGPISKTPNKDNNRIFLKENFEKFDLDNVEYYEDDYREIFKYLFEKEPNLKIDIYFYDGEHSEEGTLEGYERVLPHLSEKCIILTDDTNWGRPSRANDAWCREHSDFRSIVRIPGTPSKSKGKFRIWWNGFEIMVRGF